MCTSCAQALPWMRVTCRSEHMGADGLASRDLLCTLQAQALASSVLKFTEPVKTGTAGILPEVGIRDCLLAVSSLLSLLSTVGLNTYGKIAMLTQYNCCSVKMQYYWRLAYCICVHRSTGRVLLHMKSH